MKRRTAKGSECITMARCAQRDGAWLNARRTRGGGGSFSVSALEFEHEQMKSKEYKRKYFACIALQPKSKYLVQHSAQPPNDLRRCHGTKSLLWRLLRFFIPPSGGCSKLSTETQCSVHVGRGLVGVQARICAVEVDLGGETGVRAFSG